MTLSDTRLSRRAALATAATTLTGGCAQRFGNVVGRDGSTQLSLQVTTLPADADPVATRLARRLATNLGKVGIDAEIVPQSREALRRSVLLNGDFDLYVYPSPAVHDPDQLRPLLHSRFGSDRGWTNPFGYANLTVDDLLEKQAAESPPERTETLVDLQEAIAKTQPFTVVAFPDTIRASRVGRVGGLQGRSVHTPEGYLSVTPVRDAGPSTASSDDDPSTVSAGNSTAVPERDTRTTTGEDPTTEGVERTATNDEPTTLRMGLTDSRPTENLNPLAEPFRRTGTVIDLLYDSVGRRLDGVVQPWLAASWEWTETGETPVAEVTLRPDLHWHDGEPLTATDVAFTFRFLADTALGQLSTPVPAPRYRGRTSLVDEVTALSGGRVRFTFDTVSQSVARRAFTVPVLPEHVWREFTDRATVAGLNVGGVSTRALVRSNLDPVGSGPLQVRSASPRESLVLERVDDHFLTRTELPSHLQLFAGGFGFDRLSFTVVPSAGAASELLQRGTLDATATPLRPENIRGVAEADSLDLHLDGAQWCYHVGYNHRRAPLGNPRFRRTVAQLIDKAALVEELFDGYATPAASPLAATSALAPSLRWTGEDPVLPFLGDSGTLDVDRARDRFRELGYRYSADGRLLVNR